MDDGQFDTLTRAPHAPRSRRMILWSGMAWAGALGSHVTGDTALARKRCRKKGKKPSPPSCAEACPASCNLCVRRKVDSVLCSAGVFGAPACGEPCFSDNDCVNTPYPYCVTHTENRRSGDVVELECNGVLGRCTTILPCVV